MLRGVDVLVPVTALEQAGLLGFGGAREILDGMEHVSLASLAPAVTFEVDESALVLRVTADPRLFAASVVDLTPGPPAGITFARDPSAFLNYALTWRDAEDPAGQLDGFAEAGFSLGRALLLSTFSRPAEEGIVRGLTQLSVDERRRLRRWIAGDQLALSQSPLGGAALLGGVGVSRDFGLDPYLVRFPTPDLSGLLLTPATVEVYVNGLLVRREELRPGRFELRDVPVPSGSGATRVVVRDAFGQVRESSEPYYFATGLLVPGLSDYGFHLGAVREGLGVESFDYGDLAFLGRWRAGWTDRLTAGGWLEGRSDLVSGGPVVNIGRPRGELAAAAAARPEDGAGGAAGSLAYSSSGRRFTFGALLRARTDRFAHLGLPAAADRPIRESGGFAGVSFGPHLSLTLQGLVQEMRDGAERENGSLTGRLRLGGRSTLFLVASRFRDAALRGGDSEDRLLAALHVALGGNRSGQIAGETGTGDDRMRVDLQKPLPVGTGFGYRLSGEHTGGREVGIAELQYQNRHGRWELRREELDGRGNTSLQAAGGLVALGGRVYTSRPVQDSFALLRVPGVPGVRGYRSNQEVGRTDARGDLLVPDLLAYYGNRLAIADQDVPMSHTVEERETVLAPPRRGGAVVRFPVWRLRALIGILVLKIDGTERVPTPGRLSMTVGESVFESPVGNDGAFYLENVPAGKYPAVVESDAGRCELSLVVPETEAVLVDLGRIVCEG